mgnify:CR=1 FL=1
MEQSKIDRINELARKAKSGQPLTAEEMAEREELRAEYLQAVRTHMANVLEHTVIQYPDGRREKVRAKTAPVAAPENPEEQMVRAALAPGGEPLCLVSDSVGATERQGAALARLFEASVGTDDPLPPFVALYGDLGAGKTAFVRGFASILAPGVAVHSPTFALVNEYRAPEHPPLFHFDMYRMSCTPWAMRTISTGAYASASGARISRMPCLPSAWKCASERMRRIRIGALCRYA